MHHVSFKVAKELRKLGYPQTGMYKSFEPMFYDKKGKLNSSMWVEFIPDDWTYAPVAYEVWTWLWVEKKISIDIDNLLNNVWGYFFLPGTLSVTTHHKKHYSTPEDALFAAIDDLIENNAIQ